MRSDGPFRAHVTDAARSEPQVAAVRSKEEEKMMTTSASLLRWR